eukprot:CAMPEP_0172472730 /NCGR_PEP_ID=MMETSP1065-20121228/68492_1 /TAXON_ID=265537 /ORGANISM="Amphiprora paludosa, Strain CCMP125" /LENGTH=371 /DNA_ID=CAMNT_0013230887 /DNA_START=528 /DNA_END=1643 /DNA_ORIENTATION=+
MAVEELTSSTSSAISTAQQQLQSSDWALPDWKSIPREELISKTINALFLIVCFGLAFYSILDINHGITRGWTQQEIALRIPLDTWSSYEAALEEKPVVTKTMINVIIYLLGDWLSQTVFAKRNVLDFDLSRTLRNGLIGLGFGPLVHEYYQFSDAILPLEGGMGNRILKIFMDQTIYLSVKCSIYILAVNTLQGQNWKESSTAVKEKLPGIVVTAWKFWPLIHCITYSVIPARHRILWVNCVDLIWNAILASMSQQKEEDEPELEAVAIDTTSVVVLEAVNGADLLDAASDMEVEQMKLLQQQHVDMEKERLSDTPSDVASPILEVVLEEDPEETESKVLPPKPLKEIESISNTEDESKVAQKEESETPVS